MMLFARRAGRSALSSVRVRPPFPARHVTVEAPRDGASAVPVEVTPPVLSELLERTCRLHADAQAPGAFTLSTADVMARPLRIACTHMRPPAGTGKGWDGKGWDGMGWEGKGWDDY